MLNSAQEAAIAAKLEQERLDRVAERKRREAEAQSKRTGWNQTSDMEMDRQAARDGYSPNW